MKKISTFLLVIILAVSMSAQEFSKSAVESKSKDKQIAFYPTMSYQGLMKDSDGKLLEDGKYQLTFKLYDSQDGSESLWKEDQTIEIKSGVVNAFIEAVEKLN